MKLVVIIPCLNEEKTLPDVLKTIPKKIGGIKKIEIVVIDDGSTDRTVKAAKKYGVKHFVLHHKNMGLARSFSDGLDKALSLGADIIVNTDGDNQYPQEDIPRLIKPILDNKADMVIADRQTHAIKHFPFFKKVLQKIGSFTVGYFSNITIPDAVSGFRAYSRLTAMRLNVFTDYTYTIETLIQAGKRRKRVAIIKIKTNEKHRESRLIKSVSGYLKISAATILRVFAIYEPLKTFIYIGFFIALPGVILITRFIYLFLASDKGAHIQSIIIGGVFILVGFQVGIIGIVADLIGINRKLNEEILFRLKCMEYKKFKPNNKNKSMKTSGSESAKKTSIRGISKKNNEGAVIFR